MAAIISDIRQAERLTNEPKHHLFGFHDLVISNAKSDKYLAIESDNICRPPLRGEKFGVGYVFGHEFHKIGETTALNYPQGARQQWIGQSDCFTVNDRVGNEWGTKIYDTESNKLIHSFPATTHMLTSDGRLALGLDYARLHRLGGYGYTGIIDKYANEAIPDKAGITITDIRSGKSELLVSVRQVAECGQSDLSGKSHHYLTHLCINPSSTRAAFLHRYFMPDGGLMTRLMTIGIDGKNLRCLGQGFLSHFDWKDDNHLYIYGRVGSSVDSLRNNPIMQLPIFKYSLRTAKKLFHLVAGKNKTMGGGMSFHMIDDKDNPHANVFATGIITEDGHPMTHPFNKDWAVCDSYPNKEGDRDLFLYNFPNDTRINLGKYRRLFENPVTDEKEKFLYGMEQKILNDVSLDLIAFTRSGLHCDLHPRWSADGKWAVFDSIHEGTRQIYRVDVQDLIV